MMQILRTACFDEICQEILQHEAKTRRDTYGDLSREDLSIIGERDFDDLTRNARRKEILYSKRDGLLLRIPPDTSWYLAKVGEADLKKLHVIRTNPWAQLSKGTGLLSEAAKTFQAILEGNETLDEVSHSVCNSIRDFVIPAVSDGTINRKLTLLQSITRRTTIIDGNHRAIGIFSQQIITRSPPLEDFEVYLGISRLGCIWCWDQDQVFVPSFLIGGKIRILVNGWLETNLPNHQ